MSTPLCRHFGVCGGCDWQNLTYPEQLARKHQTLTDLLRASVGEAAGEVRPLLGMPVDDSGWPWRFRQKASFVFGEAAGQLTIGHYAAQTNRVIPITECPVHSDRANRLAFALHEHLKRARIPAAGRTVRGVLRHLLVRTTHDDREAIAMLVVTENHKSLRTPVRKFLDSRERPTGFFVNVHDRPGPYMIGRETLRIEGRSHVRDDVAGLRFLISPTAFFQTNTRAAGTLVGLVVEHTPIDRALNIADLYAGSGLFSLPLAARGHRVTAIEENAQAVEDGKRNATLNGLDDRVRFVRSAIEDALSQIERGDWDVCVIDPPRAGCPASVLQALFHQARPATVVYVSCNPTALATELPTILAAGYRIARIQPVDMFPHTTHIETVVTLTYA